MLQAYLNESYQLMLSCMNLVLFLDRFLADSLESDSQEYKIIVIVFIAMII